MTVTYFCHRVSDRYIIYLSCLAVKAGFYSDVVKCSTLTLRFSGSIPLQGTEFFLRVRDILITFILTRLYSVFLLFCRHIGLFTSSEHLIRIHSFKPSRLFYDRTSMARTPMARLPL